MKNHTRIPNKYKKIIRKSKNTTFIYPNKNSYRVVSKDLLHHNFINKFDSMYSTSANETNKNFSDSYAISNSEIILFTKSDFEEKKSSSIYKVAKNNIIKLR